MAISYNKLWKLLVDKKTSKADSAQSGRSSRLIPWPGCGGMKKSLPAVLSRICAAVRCEYWRILWSSPVTKGMDDTMADTKLFNIKGTVKEYQSGTVTLEKELQTVIENNMNLFFGVTFLASEYRTTDGGRMDSIGIDENHCPVIFEYKRSVKENVINQGSILFELAFGS